MTPCLNFFSHASQTPWHLFQCRPAMGRGMGTLRLSHLAHRGAQYYSILDTCSLSRRKAQSSKSRDPWRVLPLCCSEACSD